MVWSPEKRAGFALAALLFDDRELGSVTGTIPPSEREAVAKRLALSEGKHASVRDLLSIVRPELDDAALLLAPRARGLLARVSKAALRGRIAEGTPPARAHFTLDEPLFAILMRAALRARQAALA